MLAMSGRVTMRGMARGADKGGSYRTIQRFFTSRLSWGTLPWVLIRHHLCEQDDGLLMGGDAVVGTQAGKPTYGLDRFFSSLLICCHESNFNQPPLHSISISRTETFRFSGESRPLLLT